MTSDRVGPERDQNLRHRTSSMNDDELYIDIPVAPLEQPFDDADDQTVVMGDAGRTTVLNDRTGPKPQM